jgi:hypothetical protein
MSCCRGCCWRPTPRRASFSTSNLMSSFWEATIYSRLTGRHDGGGGGALARGACPRPVDGSGLSSYCSSVDLICTLPHRNILRSSARRHLTSCQFCWGPQVRVAPVAVTPKAAARGWQSSPPSHQARHPMP